MLGTAQVLRKFRTSVHLYSQALFKLVDWTPRAVYSGLFVNIPQETSSGP